MIWDVFISHASEDKDDVAAPLCEALQRMGLSVWLDRQQLRLGDKLSQKINEGLSLSRFGVVILSENFFQKDFAQRELQALTAIETAQGGYIIPILHQVEHDFVKQRVPLIADNLAGATVDGIDRVAEQIYNSVRYVNDEKEIKYFPNFDFPPTLINSAISAIDSMASPKVWRELEITNDMGKSDIWLGTDSDTAIKLIYDIFSPIIYFDYHQYNFERSISSFGVLQRYKFSLLEEVKLALFQDRKLAASGKTIEYSPRVPNWRVKRQKNQQTYWWQGLTEERLRDARSAFLKSSNDPSKFELVGFQDFKDRYLIDFCRPGDHQMTIGLLGNAIFGFSPKNRPVFWRMLHFWNVCYETIKGTDEKDSVDERVPSWTSRFELTFPEDDLYEPLDDTFEALSEYWNGLVAGSIKMNLRQSIERE